MTESSQLVPAPVGARGKAKGKLGVAFGRRFFLLLLVGLVPELLPAKVIPLSQATINK